MKKQISFYILFFSSLVMLLSYHGCSELEDNLVSTEGGVAHGAGWLNPTSNNFHGKFIAANKWDLNGCKTCHGTDYRGGNTGAGCYDCHTQGPEFCNVCHGNADHINPPKGLNGDTSATSIHVGAHFKHLNAANRISAVVACTECHLEITSFSDTNHIGPDPDGIADINFGPLARKSLGGGVVPNPQWNRTSATCSSVYCHGAFKGGNVNNTVTWTQPGSVVCGSCHGNPQTGNPNPAPYPSFVHDPGNTITDCVVCHPAVISSQGQIIAPEKHVNGVINTFQ